MKFSNSVKLQPFFQFPLLLLLSWVKDIINSLAITDFITWDTLAKVANNLISYRRIVVLFKIMQVLWVIFCSFDFNLSGKEVSGCIAKFEASVGLNSCCTMYFLLHGIQRIGLWRRPQSMFCYRNMSISKVVLVLCQIWQPAFHNTSSMLWP